MKKGELTVYLENLSMFSKEQEQRLQEYVLEITKKGGKLPKSEDVIKMIVETFPEHTELSPELCIFCGDIVMRLSWLAQLCIAGERM